MRAVLYARVSSDDRERDNLGGQLDMCRTYALDRGYTVVTEFAEDERGISGATLQPPELAKVLDMARDGAFDVLVCREMDRLARSLAKQLFVEAELERYNVQVEYVLAEYDETPEGRFQKLVRASVAEYERLKIVERLERGRKASARKGNVLTGGHPPFGYRIVTLDDGRRTLAHDPETQRDACNIFEWYVYGDEKKARFSLRGVARKLESLGVLSPADRGRVPPGKTRPPGTWSPTSVREILMNPVFKGEWTYNPADGTEPIIVHVPPLVDEATWDAAQRRLAQNKRLSRRNTRHQYLLRGRIRCGKCGYTFSAKKDRRMYYRCCAASTRDDLPVKCDQRYIRLKLLDERVWGCIAGLFSTPGAVREEYGRLREQPDRVADAELVQVNAEIERLENRLIRLRHLYLDGDLGRAEYRNKRDALKVELDKFSLRQEILYESTGHADNAILETLEGFTEKIHAHIAGTTDFEERLWYIDTLDVEVLVTPERKAIISAHGVKVGVVDCD